MQNIIKILFFALIISYYINISTPMHYAQFLVPVQYLNLVFCKFTDIVASVRAKLCNKQHTVL